MKSNVTVVRASTVAPPPRPAGHLQAATADRYAPMQLGARVAHLHELENCGRALGAGECPMCMAYAYALEGGPPLPSLEPEHGEDRRAAEAAYYASLDRAAGEEE